ncbi:diadenylate cyclase CdaA [Gelria sp. Kuro-4]|uniref:diadenylate cyclase CdaA n=1 Tax=Gelria sp. Kuro-4 TaxID=2796927 RepID=UPI001BEEE60F|nr:diadenylate cyclase CdaA [Gelria sp. Kuro-4]BCV24375.1 membrane protein [Gelria sp. Kuro-4]
MLEQLRHLSPLDILDILIVAFVFYRVIVWIRGTRAVQLLKGLAVLLLAYFFSRRFGLAATSWLLDKVMTMGLIAVPIIFQPELRRGLEQLGRGRLFTPASRLLGEEDVSRMIQEVVRAVQVLARNKVGALIVLERRTGLKEVEETGIPLDALVSAEFLVNVFVPNTPLHDGATIIRNDRVVAAGCFLPLTENQDLSKDLGTRHRAALGISEQSDCVAIVVSEETGIISVAQEGRLRRHLDEGSLKDLLAGIFKQEATLPFLRWGSSHG